MALTVDFSRRLNRAGLDLREPPFAGWDHGLGPGPGPGREKETGPVVSVIP